MLFCVSSLRLLVITLLILCSLAGIKTNAIPQPKSDDGRNENGSEIFSKTSDITTSRTTDLEKAFDETNIEYERKKDSDSSEEEDVETPDTSTTEVPRKTTPSNIYSVTTKRNKTKNRIKSESRNIKSTIVNTSTTSAVTTSEPDVNRRTSAGDSELANIDIEDDDDDETLLNRKKNNNISTEKFSTSWDKNNELTGNKNLTHTNGSSDFTDKNSNTNQEETPPSKEDDDDDETLMNRRKNNNISTEEFSTSRDKNNELTSNKNLTHTKGSTDSTDKNSNQEKTPPPHIYKEDDDDDETLMNRRKNNNISTEEFSTSQDKTNELTSNKNLIHTKGSSDSTDKNSNTNQEGTPPSHIYKEDDDDDETLLNRRKNNYISTEKFRTSRDKNNELTSTKNLTHTNRSSDSTDKNSNTSQAETPPSHIYKVNSNYKRNKKLNILPPKRYWRDPNDNSWRNESISSLGIKFKPKANATKAFQFRKKDLSELETNISETENSTSPGLRERLEKLSEIRKSKKKFNTSAEISGEEFDEYEGESIEVPLTVSPFIVIPKVYGDENFIRISTTTASSETTSTPYKKLNERKNIMKVLRDSKLVTISTKNNMTNTVRKNSEMKPNNFDSIEVEHEIELKVKTDAFKKESAKHKRTNTVRQDTEKLISDTNHHEVRYDNKKDEIFPKSVNQRQFDYALEPENNDEIHDYELELSKEVLNSSESWSEKEYNAKTSPIPSANQDNKVRESTNILDSLDEYLNYIRHSTTPITPLYKSSNDNIHEKYMQSQLSKPGDKSFTTINPNTLPKFINPVNLPLGPRNKDKISLSHSYSYNTIPHKEISVQYNTTVIHQSTPEHNYNIPLPTNPTYLIPSSVNDQQSDHEVVSGYDPDKFSNRARINHRAITRIAPIPQTRGLEFTDIVNVNKNIETIETVPRNFESMNSNFGSNKNIEPTNENTEHVHHNLGPLDHNTKPIHQNSEPLNQNVKPRLSTALLNEIFEHVNQNARPFIQNITPINQNIEHINQNKPIKENIESAYQNFRYTSQNIEPSFRNTEQGPENYRALPKDITDIPRYTESIPQYLEKIIVPISQNNEPQNTRPILDLQYIRPLLSPEIDDQMKATPTMSPSILRIIPSNQNIVNNIIHHTNVANHESPIKTYISGILKNAITYGPRSRPNIHEEIIPPVTGPTSVSEEFSRSGSMDREVFQEPVLPNFINQSPIVPSKTGRRESKFEIPIVPNDVLQRMPQHDFMFQNINPAPIVENGKHETQIPMLFNSTVLHTMHENDNAVSNTYVRSLYEDMFLEDARDVMAYIEGDRGELSPGFLIRYNFPHQNKNN